MQIHLLSTQLLMQLLVMCSSNTALQYRFPASTCGNAGTLQVVGFDTVADGWVSPSAAADGALGLSSFALGNRAGAGMPFSVHSIWMLPDAVAMDNLAVGPGNASLDATLAAMAAAPSPPAITLDQSTVLTGVLVDTPVRVVVNAGAGSSNTTALGLKLRLTFFGATPM
jgi:hypothetical protein